MKYQITYHETFELRHKCVVALVLLALLGSKSAVSANPPGESQFSLTAELPVDFEKEVEPIFRKHCYSCHGPEKQESGFRLDDPVAATEGGDLGVALVPGDSAESPLVDYISGANEYIVMPPEDATEARLTAEEVGLVRAWIDQGARWPKRAERPLLEKKNAPVVDHWAFRRPVYPEAAMVKTTEWLRNPIDSFVLARLEKAGLTPAPEADRRTLIRRLSLDLTGLPPTVEEVNRFLNDLSSDAYEQLVERLLESPHYGERWALWWLDLARYADTNGYEIDRPRSIWPYRDWVIAAFNSNLPFDQFAIEQLAGDLLPNATLSNRVATGFHRNTFTNEEGGHNWEQFRWESIVDRVHTTSTVFLGLTLSCAQCHDHKFDPISQREYYEFFAFLNNDDEPLLEVPQPNITEKRRSLRAEIAKLQSQLESRFLPSDDSERLQKHYEEEFEKWRHEAATAARAWSILKPVKATSDNNATLTELEDHSILAHGDNPEVDRYEIVYRLPAGKITGIKLEAIPHPSLPMHGPGRGYLKNDGTFVLSEINVSQKYSGDENALQRVKLVNPSATYAAKSIADAIDGEKLTGWHISQGAGRRHCAVFEFAEPLITTENGELIVSLVQNYAHQQTLGRFRLWATSSRPPLQASDMPTEVEQTLLKPVEKWSDKQSSNVKAYYLSVAPELQQEQAKISKLVESMPLQPTTLVLEQRATLRPTHQHIRGEFARPGPEVTANVPRFLHSLPSDAPRNRLTFARWLVDKKNPLVARVIMNQIWQCYFGRGLVNTPEDFGTQGTKPSHPELLDWLACRFMDEDWDLKQIHRIIVTSNTYRQAAISTPQKIQNDPENILLSRGPRFRLPAETVRDIVLTASGLLNPAIGGPSVFPWQPEGALVGVFGDAKWNTSTRPDCYRRGIYTHRKRTAPYAAFAAFDSPPYRTCTMQRVRSNTPLQALAELNDRVVIEASQALAKRILEDASEEDSLRLNLAYQCCLGRLPSIEERRTILSYYNLQRGRMEQDEATARTVAGLTNRNSDDRRRVADLAAWTLVARVLLNLDETISKE